MRRVQGVLAAVAVALLSCVAEADERKPPTKPVSPADGAACGGTACVTTQSIKWSLLEFSHIRVVEYTPTAPAPSVTQSVPDKWTYVWKPSGMCQTNTNLPQAQRCTKPCGGCSYEAVKVPSTDWERKIDVDKVYADVYRGRYWKAGPQGGNSEPKLTAHIWIGDKLVIGPWENTGSHDDVRSLCECAGTFKTGDTLPQYPKRVKAGGLFPAEPGAVTQGDDAPNDKDQPGTTWRAMPSTCTNPQCESKGGAAYSRAYTVGTSSSEHPVFDGWKTIELGGVAVDVEPKFKNVTYTGVTSFTTTWSVDTATCSCVRKKNPAGGFVVHTKPCGQGTCEYEALPTGNASRSWSRAMGFEPIEETVEFDASVGGVVGGKLKDLMDAGTKITAVVPVGWKVSFGDWMAGDSNDFPGTTDKCDCHMPPTTGNGDPPAPPAPPPAQPGGEERGGQGRVTTPGTPR